MMKHLLLFCCILPFFASAEISAIQEIVTPKGIRIWLYEDHASPIVSIKAAFRKAGNVADPKNKEGCSLFLSEMALEGAGNLSGREICEQLENVGGKIGFFVDEDNFFLSITYTKQHQHLVLYLSRLVMTEPTLSAEAIQRVQQRLIAEEALRKDNPEVLGERAMRKAAYGDHPYARHPTKASLQAIAQQDLIAFKNQRLAKDQLIVIIVGDMPSKEAIDCVDGVFGALPDKASPLDTPHISPQFVKEGVRVQKFLPQNIVFWYQDGIRASDPDFFAFQIANHVLGGGPQSRLHKKLRLENGLVYFTYTFWNQLACTEILVGMMRTESLDRAVDFVRQEWSIIAERGITEEELAGAKKFLNGSFILFFTDCQRIASLLMNYALLCLPPDILQTCVKKIQEVTLESVNKAIKQHLNRKLTFVSVGP
ncbi:MAG: insulinase family protein [Holosporales bacterium]|jgi:zinc protease|nr:insulinase family protein [Holosporales bacterium]